MSAHRTKEMVAAGAAVVLLAAGCGSTKTTTNGGGSTTGGGTAINVGVIDDATGLGASGNKTFVDGVKAGVVLAKRAGYDLTYELGDTQTSPAAAEAAATSLVTQDHVLAVLAGSALTFAAAPYLTHNGIPVIGEAEDGAEWITSNNMFAITGYLNPTQVGTTGGAFLKMEGVTDVGTLGYGISPSSADSARGYAISAQHAGLKAGYVNAQFPFGSTNVQPIALAMKAAGVNGVYSATDPNTSFSLVTALTQLGDPPKVALLPDGYGGDLTTAGAAAEQQAQGLYFALSFEPVEMQTAATKQFVSDLAAAGVTGEATFGEYNGYVSVAALLLALKAAGPHPTHAALITALSGITGFNAAGLLGSHSFALSDRTGTAGGVDDCSYIVKFEGTTFHLVPGADPICGSQIPGASAGA